MHIGIIIVIVIFLITAFIKVGNVNARQVHTVRSGESIWSIAQSYGSTVNQIKQASNHWSDLIRPGQRLIIPTSQNQTANSRQISQNERNLLNRLVQAEAEGEPYQGKVGVVAVVLNRVNDPAFPNTISGVIYERHAFESVTNNLIWNRMPSQQTQNAVQDALNGWDPTSGSLFFWNPYKPVTPWIWSRPIITQYGNHVFAR